MPKRMSDIGLAPAEGRAPRHRQGQGPKERPSWWRIRSRGSYKLHCGVASEDWSRHGGAGGGPEPTGIVEAINSRARVAVGLMAHMDDDEQQPVCRCWTSIHPQEDRQFNVMDLTDKHPLPSTVPRRPAIRWHRLPLSSSLYNRDMGKTSLFRTAPF